MSNFTDILIVSPMSDGKTWIIMRPFGYEVGSEDSGDTVEVPVGFQTDFASIPRLFWAILPKWGRYGNGAVIHDWLYWEQERERREADSIFLEAMEVLKVGAAVRYVMYWAVRAFGWLAWYRNQCDRAASFPRVLSDVKLKATAESRRPGLARRMSGRLLTTVRRRDR